MSAHSTYGVRSGAQNTVVGKLLLEVVEAEGLPAADIIGLTSDPFCAVGLGLSVQSTSIKKMHRTKVCKKV